MAPRIRTIDAAVSAMTQVRTLTTKSHDIMNTASVSRVVSSLQSASQCATRQASADYVTYQKASEARAKETAARLKALKHSSVSQDIAALLQFSATAAPKQDIKAGEEMSARELARMGAFGRNGESSRRIELAL